MHSIEKIPFAVAITGVPAIPTSNRYTFTQFLYQNRYYAVCNGLIAEFPLKLKRMATVLFSF